MLSRHRSRSNDVTHIVLRQQIGGIDVWNGDLAIYIASDGAVVALHSSFHSRGDAPLANLGIGAAQACHAAASHLGLAAAPNAELLEAASGPDLATRLRDPGLSSDEIPARLMWWPAEDGPLRLVWNLLVRVPSGESWLDINVDASAGHVVSQVDWSQRDSYRVYPLPLRSPDEGDASLEVDPAESVASPHGWHDSDGSPGAEHTTARGNNAAAQEDQDANDQGGFSPDGSSSLVFDFAADLSRQPTDYEPAAVVNAFYTVNRMHDILYHYGFDEAAGNFQMDNYGRGGGGGCTLNPLGDLDAVAVDVQDGAARNNATFQTPPDGMPARLQLHVFTDGSSRLDITSAATSVGSYIAAEAGFGRLLPEQGISAPIVQALDAATQEGPSTTDGCSAFSNAAAVAGNIAIIDRGGCFFVDKVANAEAAGAVGAIVVNNDGDQLVVMAGGVPGDPGPDLESLFVGQTLGQAIQADLVTGVEGTLWREGGSVRDSALDNGTVAHEFAHGLTSRLTGGRCNANCLTTLQAAGMAEGWSDWYQMALSRMASDRPEDPVPIATYLAFQDAGGGGLRSIPYSSDMLVNALTYGALPSRIGEHAVGEIWALALWDLYWNLDERYGFDPDPLPGTAGNHLAMQLVSEALALQPCNPSFIEGRDALLLADELRGGDNQCEIWRAFTRRGMGPNAASPEGSNSATVVTDFSLPAECVPEPGAAALRIAALAALAFLSRRARGFACAGPRR